MKKILLIAVAFLAFATSNAQSFIKGDTFLEGTANFVTSDVTETFNLSPKAGYFVTDKVAVGASITTGNAKDFNVSIFARNYFLSVGKSLKIYSELGITNSNPAAAEAYISANLGVGLNYFVTENLAITTNLVSLASYDDQNSRFELGFNGLNNPLATPTFGLLYRF